MSYKIDNIEGIGPSFGEKLANAGIKTTDSLLHQCSDRRGRRAVSARTGISEKYLLKWANLADLMRIKGIGPQFSELLKAAGVDTVEELRNRNADHLTAKLKAILEIKRIARSNPAVSTVQRWIGQARAMEAASSQQP